MRAVEDIPFDRIRQVKATSQEKKFTDMQQAMQSSDKHAIVGRWVGGRGSVEGGRQVGGVEGSSMGASGIHCQGLCLFLSPLCVCIIG